MPQINRIRVNNVKYNFGTQFYDDFVMRFSCKNTIYDLANGGGKSVLMLLLLQTVIPNCTLDDKQPVEKLFRTNSGSTTIHSMVEWKLDSCDVREGFRYMTCGFCARKGRNDAGVASVAEEETAASSDESAAIDYFNYCIFYRQFGDNDIKNLPLSNGEERVTYNGLKNYLRDLEKKDFGVKVYIFDKKSDYQNFISDYGIYESQWEIIRGINKTEGHVRTYFENTYKTTRKVVEDLLIEEIIEKSYNNRIKSEPEDEQMAKTLLDIKDKLLELAKRREEIENYDRQTALLRDFRSKVTDFGELFSRKENIKNVLATGLSRAKRASILAGDMQQEAENKQKSVMEGISREEMLIALADITADEKAYEASKELVSECESQIKALVNERNDAGKRLNDAQNANDYREYLEASGEYDRLKAYIDNRSMDSGTAGKKLVTLAFAKKRFYDEAVKNCELKISELSDAIEACKKDISEHKDELLGVTERINISVAKTSFAKEQSEKLMKEVSKLLEGTGLIASDSAGERLTELEGELSQAKSKYDRASTELEEISAKLNYCLKENALCEADIASLTDRVRLARERKEAMASDEEKYEKISSIYHETSPERLYSEIDRIYEEMLSAEKEILGRIEFVNSLTEAIKQKILPENTKLDIYTYLEERYPGCVISGAEYTESLDSEMRDKALRLVPFITSCFVIKSNSEAIFADSAIRETSCDGIVPLITMDSIEAGLRDESYELFSDNIALSFADYSFIYDEAAASARLKRLFEEHDHLMDEYGKKHDRLTVVREDRDFVYIYNVANRKNGNLREEIEALENELEKAMSKKDGLIELRENLTSRQASLKEEACSSQKNTEKLIANINAVGKIKELNDEIDKLYKIVDEETSKKIFDAKQKKNLEEIIDSKTRVLSDKSLSLGAVRESLKEIQGTWNKDFAAFYRDENPQDAELGDILRLPENEINARFYAMKEIVSGHNQDISDKENLMNNYLKNMEMLRRSMEYRGLDLSSDLSGLEQLSMDFEEMKAFKKSHDDKEKLIEAKESELSGICAQMNRIEGSIAHARGYLEEKYGEVPEVSIPDPATYKKEHQAKKQALSQEREALVLEYRKLSQSLNQAILLEKELERTVRSLDMDPDSIVASEDNALVNSESINEAYKEYEKLTKDENRRREDFIRQKDKLVTELSQLSALELANELKGSLYTPKNQEEVRELSEGLEETAECINLEKDRIGHQIEAMESIKDSFENRCIQICQNIKNELERLPKLSKITLDDEVIPMLSLTIPYVKDAQYKERMSAYISETVSAAENFDSTVDKLKFIRSRLTWKKLFSVIVTDMNSIKLNLYKRERIKDQSRYLKYEEAVGSTGQSQGIYIQFLVSIINYIASLNAGGKEASVLGKSIFIDNPFGAAKDVYIWEPIFKMLKTNHVQLIVPARGATPAITGRFDVNYVLGQKMVGTRQQTVVVDYRSQVSGDEVEYSRLEFTQGTLNLEFK